MMKGYKIATRFIFDGFFIVKAETLLHARQKVCESCGLVLGGGIHSTLPDEEIKWEFPVHPEMSILDARQIYHKNEAGEDNHG
jgi:hypothetical protein